MRFWVLEYWQFESSELRMTRRWFWPCALTLVNSFAGYTQSHHLAALGTHRVANHLAPSDCFERFFRRLLRAPRMMHFRVRSCLALAIRLLELHRTRIGDLEVMGFDLPILAARGGYFRNSTSKSTSIGPSG